MICQLPFPNTGCKLLIRTGAYDNLFKVQLAWVSAIFLFIGGGTHVFNSLVFATVSASLAHLRRYVLDLYSPLLYARPIAGNSTKYLYFLHAGPHINRLITPRIAAALMGTSLFPPFIISFVLLGVALAVTRFVDEHCGKDESHVQYRSIPSEDRTSAIEVDEHGQLSRNSESETAKALRSTRSDFVGQTSRDSFYGLPKRIAKLSSTSATRFCLFAFTSEGFMFQ